MAAAAARKRVSKEILTCGSSSSGSGSSSSSKEESSKRERERERERERIHVSQVWGARFASLQSVFCSWLFVFAFVFLLVVVLLVVVLLVVVLLVACLKKELAPTGMDFGLSVAAVGFNHTKQLKTTRESKKQNTAAAESVLRRTRCLSDGA